MNIVVGSGPAGVTVAKVLLDRGEDVTVIDGGRVLDDDRAELVRSLAEVEPGRWPPDARQRLALAEIPPHGVPKLEFGSDHPYDLGAALEQHGTHALLSLARGGLSTVWGAAALPSRALDRPGWPLDAHALDAHYAAVTRLLGVAGEEDALSAVLPTHGPLAPPLPLSRQALAVLARSRRGAVALRGAGLTVGRSRLAVRATDDPARGLRGCRLTADCMGGCVYGAIWRATEVTDALRGRKGFHERPGFVVRRVGSDADGAWVEGRDGTTGSTRVRGARVFLAAGPIATARIVIDSLGLHGRPIPLRFQPYFAVPLLTVEACVGEPRHALAQLFIELDDPRVSRHLVHLQLYTQSPRLTSHLREALGPLGRILGDALAPRLAAIQGYLHSDEAPPITLTAEAGVEAARLTLRAPDLAAVDRAVNRVMASLVRHAPRLGILPLSLRRGTPGEGNHLGGSFPMRHNPTMLETDSLGRMTALPGVHLVDASVLPGLPATTFTLTVMANAHRIATLSGAR